MVGGVESAVEEPAVEKADDDGNSHVEEEGPKVVDSREGGGGDEVGKDKGWDEALETELCNQGAACVI